VLGYGVVLAAICVATAGPIGFIALAAPQLARRLSRSAGMTLIASAAMGAVLLGGADFLAQRLLSPFQIPVGLVSAALGGLSLVWLLMLVFGSGHSASKRNWAKASLIWMVISVVLSIAFFFVLSMLGYSLFAINQSASVG